jgi:hypothetical protein
MSSKVIRPAQPLRRIAAGYASSGSHGGEVMAAKRPNPIAKAVAVLFSSLVAPLAVNLTASALKSEGHPPVVEPVRPFAGDSPMTPAPTVVLLPPASVTRADDRPTGSRIWRPAVP